MTLTPVFLLIVTAGAGLGLGLYLLLLARRGSRVGFQLPHALRWNSIPRATRIRWAAAIAAFMLALLVTRWIVVAAAVGAAILAWPRLFGGARSQANEIRKLEALAGWVESLRDTISTGQALPEALPLSASTASAEIAEPLTHLVDRMRARQSLDVALLQFADELDDPTADSIVGALTMNARVQGQRLKLVLTSLAESVRKQLTIRREIEAERRGLRRGVNIVMVFTAVMVIGMTVFNRSYVEPYSSATGQLVLVLVILLFAGGFAWLRKLADFETPERFLATPDALARQQAQTQAAADRLPSTDPNDVEDRRDLTTTEGVTK